MSFESLSSEIRACTLCKDKLPMGPNPVFQAGPKSRILIAGQAPGIRVHKTSIPFNDPSGERLRRWMGIDEEIFYDAEKVAIVPMGFCYPGTGKSGDLPPLPECSQTWHERLLQYTSDIKLILPIGLYAQRYYLGSARKKTLTETVKSWEEYAPSVLPLPHPSPRNNIWLKKNPWFEEMVIPHLQQSIAEILNH
ncbi:MAG: uracil-DNA glycosylase family protein [Gammaproteobacteria bacterium]|nr:uracil-DNA glycosylase family protein [Gammaproteobacteria bacterium]